MSPSAPFLVPERDASSKIGRAKGGGTTYLTVPGNSISSITTLSHTLNTDWYSPFFTPTPLIIDQLVCEVTTGASGNLRMGLYKADADWQPIGAPLADSGNIAITVAVKTYTPGTPLYLPRGRYLGVVNLDTTSTLRAPRTDIVTLLTPSLGSSGAISSLSVGRTYAAFPTPGTAWTTTATGAAPGILTPIAYRVSTP